MKPELDLRQVKLNESARMSWLLLAKTRKQIINPVLVRASPEEQNKRLIFISAFFISKQDQALPYFLNGATRLFIV